MMPPAAAEYLLQVCLRVDSAADCYFFASDTLYRVRFTSPLRTPLLISFFTSSLAEPVVQFSSLFTLIVSRAAAASAAICGVVTFALPLVYQWGHQPAGHAYEVLGPALKRLSDARTADPEGNPTGDTYVDD
jgi:hypothetical protein